MGWAVPALGTEFVFRGIRDDKARLLKDRSHPHQMHALGAVARNGVHDSPTEMSRDGMQTPGLTSAGSVGLSPPLRECRFHFGALPAGGLAFCHPLSIHRIQPLLTLARPKVVALP